jgi:hypothetical protein
MSMSDINTEIKFGATFAVDKFQVKQSKGDVIEYSKSKAARALGEEIAKAKGFKMYPEDDMVRGEILVYAFTVNELRDFIEAKLKQKLINMSQRDTEKDIAERLLMLSERV